MFDCVQDVLKTFTRNDVKKSGKYLFSHKALAKVFRAKLLEALVAKGLRVSGKVPKQWVVDCKDVGSGDKALIYLGRYLYKGVIQEKDILSCDDKTVTYLSDVNYFVRFATITLSGFSP